MAASGDSRYDTDAEATIRTAGDLIDEAGSFSAFVRRFGAGGILFALIETVVSGIQSTGDLLLAPFQALASGLASLVGGTLGTGVDVIAASGEQTIASITDGLAAWLGPLAFPAGVGIVMIAIYVFVEGIGRIEFSPLVFISERR